MNTSRILPFLLMLSLLSLVACDDFLDRQPLDQLTVNNFYETVEEVDLALLGSYSPMMDVEWTGKGWMLTEIPSDNTLPGGTDPEFTPIDRFTVTADNPAISNYWRLHYRQITLANTVIARIEEMTISDTEKAPFQAEAQFLRALAYFDLVRLWGGIPLVTTPPEFGEDLLLPRASVSEVYDLIIADFETAAIHLPVQREGQGIGRATRGAALAYLSKVYLTTRDYLAARDAAKAVVDLGTYRLMTDFSENFELETSDNNEESIFQVQYTGCGPFGTGNALQAFFAPWGEGITKDRDGWGSQIPTGPVITNPNTTIMDSWEEGDLRKKWTVMTSNEHYPSINASDGGYTYPAGGASASAGNIKKYVVGSGPDICFMSTPQNFHLVRYADVLLTLAESTMEIEGGVSTNTVALDPFNAVRARAGLPALDQIDRDIILKERRMEFAFEGQRWFDLLRSTKALEIMLLHGRILDTHNLLFPIPAGELEINPKLDQTPGY